MRDVHVRVASVLASKRAVARVCADAARCVCVCVCVVGHGSVGAVLARLMQLAQGGGAERIGACLKAFGAGIMASAPYLCLPLVITFS